jgi:RNA polymerase sigma-70 factor (ECF subfamily)
VVARRRAIDRVRRSVMEAARAKEAAIMTDLERWHPDAEPDEIEDDRLRLVFTCAHPALTMEARVALTLRTVAGLSTPEIARAFLVPEATLAQRLVRAQRKIKNAGIPYRVPPAHLMPERLSGVLAVVYLLYNEGYSASAGPSPIRAEVSAEAIRLGRLVTTLMPDEPEALGLTALMLLQDSRRDARIDGDGRLLTLEEQDRSRWNHRQIAEGLDLLDRAGRLAGVGAYELQARIAACHAVAPDAASTDFVRIVGLYDALLVLHPSPVIELNRAVAVALRDGPEAGLSVVDALAASGRLGDYPLLPATRADLLRRAGRRTEAVVAYRQARAPMPTEAERDFMDRRLAELGAPEVGEPA